MITRGQLLTDDPLIAPLTRTLYCDKCKEWTEHTRGRDETLGRAYWCGCGQKIIHLIVCRIEDVL